MLWRSEGNTRDRGPACRIPPDVGSLLISPQDDKSPQWLFAEEFAASGLDTADLAAFAAAWRARVTAPAR